MPTLYLVRHAQAATGGVLLGQTNPPLSEVGRRQAYELAQILPVNSAIYTSPLRRALQTAFCLCSSPVILPELTEISYGDWDGLCWEEIEEKWPAIAREKLADWVHVNSPGGEPWGAFEERVLRAVTIVCAGPSPAVIVAHEAVNAVILRELTGVPVQSYRQKHGEIVEVDVPSKC
jgi:alpha-ribazole phosphatase